MENWSGIVISFIVLALTLGIVAGVLSEFQDNQKEYATLNNETFTGAEGSYVQLNNPYIISVSKVANLTNNTYTNYTMDYDGGRIKIDRGNAAAFNITYTYLHRTMGYNISGTGMGGTTIMADYLPTIGIILVSGLVIGLIFLYFKT